MSVFLERPVRITEWSGRALKCSESWGKTYFDWPEIFRRHREPDRLDMAIWSGPDHLSALALGVPTGQSIMMRFAEGDRRDSCPLRGKRILIALEAATNYAQLQGKREIRVQPINNELVYLYENVYGFVLESPRNEHPYYRKGV